MCYCRICFQNIPDSISSFIITSNLSMDVNCLQQPSDKTNRDKNNTIHLPEFLCATCKILSKKANFEITK